MNDSPSSAPGAPPRILVADDEADLRMILEMKLERSGMQVTVAASGPEARDLARRLRPDLAVLDVMMPGLSGLDVVRELRRDGVDLPIVMLSARATDAEIAAGYEAGATAYVTKPFSPADLVEMIKDLLGSSG